MNYLCLVFAVAISAAACGDDSPAGGSNAGGEAAGGAASGGAPGEGGAGGTPAEGGGAPQGLCTATTTVGSCPTLTSCDVNLDDSVADVLCGCAAAQEGEFCLVEYDDGGGSGCGFGANCVAGEWVEELPPD